MATIEFLSVAQIKRVLRQIRVGLLDLRRRRAILEQADAKPVRETSLDALTSQLYWLRQHLDRLVRRIAAASDLSPVESQTVAGAIDVLAATGEMMDLLRWFGAAMPLDTERPTTPYQYIPRVRSELGPGSRGDLGAGQ